MTHIRARTIARLGVMLIGFAALPAAPAFAQGTDRDLDNDDVWDY
jgi:hypothetical protein